MAPLLTLIDSTGERDEGGAGASGTDATVEDEDEEDDDEQMDAERFNDEDLYDEGNVLLPECNVAVDDEVMLDIVAAELSAFLRLASSNRF